MYLYVLGEKDVKIDRTVMSLVSLDDQMSHNSEISTVVCTPNMHGN